MRECVHVYPLSDKCILLNSSSTFTFIALSSTRHSWTNLLQLLHFLRVFSLTFALYLHFPFLEVLLPVLPSLYPSPSSYLRCRSFIYALVVDGGSTSRTSDEEHIPVSYVDSGRTAQPPTTLHIGYPRSLAPSSTNIPQPVAASTTGNSRRSGISLSLDRRCRVRGCVPPDISAI